MLKSLFVMAFAVFALINPVSAMNKDSMMMDHGHDHSKPTVAIFYADWCGSCKILDPKMKEAMAQLENKDALNVVMFDLTNDKTKAASLELAKANHLEDLYAAKAPKTGFAVLVGDTMDTSVTLTKSHSVEEIKAELENFIAKKS